MKSKNASKKSIKKSPVKLDWQKFRISNLKSANLSGRADKIEKIALKHARKFVVKKWDKLKDIRHHIIGWGLLIAGLLLALGVQVFVSQLAYRTTAPGNGGSFREGSVGSFDSLNPLYASTKSELAASQLIFSRLYNFDDAGKLKSDLAKSLTISNDERTYTITIRDDVRWHDDRKLTAEDIKFTIDLIKNPSVRSTAGSMWNEIEVNKLGDYSVEFVLPVAYAPFSEALTFSVLPKHLLDNIEVTQLRESSFSKNPVGSGPMIFQRLRSVSVKNGVKRVLHLAANQHFYSARAKVDRIELHAYATQDQLALALRDGEINAASGVELSNIKDLKDWQLSSARLGNGVFAFFNNDRNHLREPKFRAALRQAIDLKKLRSDYNQKYGIHDSLDYPITESQLWGSDLNQINWFDRQAATNSLLNLGYGQQAGKWVDSSGSPVKLSIIAVKNSNYASLADGLTDQLRDFGLTVQLKLIDLNDQSFNFVRSVLQPRDYDVLVYEIELGSDPDQFVYWHSSQKLVSGLNFSNYSNSNVDEVLATARGKAEPALRQAKYKTFINEWINDVPAIGLIQSNLNYAVMNGTSVFSSKDVFVNQEARFNQLSDFSVNQASVYTTP